MTSRHSRIMRARASPHTSTIIKHGPQPTQQLVAAGIHATLH
jgi:hypothetical protein